MLFGTKPGMGRNGLAGDLWVESLHPGQRQFPGAQIVSMSLLLAPTMPFGIGGGRAVHGAAGNPLVGSASLKSPDAVGGRTVWIFLLLGRIVLPGIRRGTEALGVIGKVGEAFVNQGSVAILGQQIVLIFSPPAPPLPTTICLGARARMESLEFLKIIF